MRKRVVVKRPRIAPFLAGLEPNYSLKEEHRYDVYLNTSVIDLFLAVFPNMGLGSDATR